IATSLGVGVVGELGRRVAGYWAGIVSAVVCAVLPILSFHGIQARPYGLVFLLAGVANLTLLTSLRRPTWRNWLKYGACVAGIGPFRLVGLVLAAAPLPILASRAYRERNWAVLRGGLVIGAALALVWPLALLGTHEWDTQLNWVPRSTLSTLGAAPG